MITALVLSVVSSRAVAVESNEFPTEGLQPTMSVSTATYKVGDTYTSQKSKVVGIIKEIVPTNKNTVRVKLDVNGATRWTTWTAKNS